MAMRSVSSSYVYDLAQTASRVVKMSCKADSYKLKVLLFSCSLLAILIDFYVYRRLISEDWVSNILIFMVCIGLSD